MIESTANTGTRQQASLRLKRLRYRSRHRGSKELDVILGGFADAYLDRLSDADLDAYEALMSCDDPVIYDWIMGHAPPPREFDTSLMKRLKAYVSKTYRT
jgi:antitoxin CptB